jgi:hypothetical protein
MPEKVKVLMTLHGVWPIPINEQIGPIELEDGMSLVTVSKDESSDFDMAGELVINLHNKGQIEMRSHFRNQPLSKLPRMGLLFELQEKDEHGSYLFMPHHYVGRSMRPKTILRLFQSGEFITSLIINEMGFDIYTPVSDSPELLYYEIEPKTIEPLKKFYEYFLEKWKNADKAFAARKGSATFDNLRLRLNNAIQFLDKSYFDEFAFQRTIGDQKSETSRNDNYLRLIFCWFGIESLVCHGKDDKVVQLKTHIPLFLHGSDADYISGLVDTYYGKRSGYVHADPEKMNRILNKELDMVRDLLKLLIMVYFFICSDDEMLKQLGKTSGINPVNGLKKMDLSKYFQEIKGKSGANFESYTFKPI